MEFLADAVNRNTVGMIGGGLLEALDRFAEGLARELECLMMHRQEEFRAGVITHAPRLLRRAMKTDPRIIGADRHDRQIDCA